MKSFNKGHGKVLVKVNKQNIGSEMNMDATRSAWPYVTFWYLNAKVWPVCSHVSSS